MTLLYCWENRSIRLTFMPEWAGCAIQIRRRYLTNYSFANILWCTINDNYVFQYLKPFWPFFGQLYLHLWQNWGSDGHFEVLNRSKSWLVQNLGPQSLCANLASSQKLAIDNWPFYNQIWSFFVNYMFIFRISEVQTDILSCWTSLNLNLPKVITQNAKMQKTQMSTFVQNCKKYKNANICILCHNFGTNQNLDSPSTSKWPSEHQFCKR